MKNFKFSKKSMFIVFASVLAFCISGCKGDDPKNAALTFSENIDKAWRDAKVDEFLAATGDTPEVLNAIRAEMMKLYGENKEINGDYDASLAASTTYGTYVGKVDSNNIVSWKGMPFAKAPTNNLRWKAPQKLDNSNKVYEAYYFGHSSVQIESQDERACLYPQGEDCLNINVWNNKSDANSKKPIMLWIHGGAYLQGGAVSPEYDGTNFVKNNPEVIYASLDYRTDFVGFVNLSRVPGGENYKESANLGLLDQIAGLKWLKENAASFGGDPERITIFGESAGGGSVSALTIIPEAKGLFKRAIVQSGSCTNFLRTAEKSISQTQRILDITGCKNMNDLLTLTPTDLRKVATICAIVDPTGYTYPQLDGITLPFDVRSKLTDETRDGIDILCGTTKDEFEYWTLFMTPEINQTVLESGLYKFESKMTEEELVRWNAFKNSLTGSEYKNGVECINYLSFHAPCRYEAKTHADNGQRVYQYFFTEEYNGNYIDPSTHNPTPYGSIHAAELPFEFGIFESDEFLCCTHEEAIRFSNIMQKMWVNFALNGDPSISDGQVSGVGSIDWDAYTSANDAIMVLNAKGCEQKVDPLKENISLIGDLYWSKLR